MSDVILQVGVKILLQNKEGKYLLLKRNSQKYPEVKQQFDIPGGRIDAGSPLLKNLSREVFEETKLSIDGEPVLMAAQDILRVPGRHVVRLTYTGRTTGVPVLDEEHESYRWYTLQELKALPSADLDGYFRELLDKGLFDT